MGGGNGYTVYRIAYDGAKDDYFVNKRPLPEVADAAKEYKSVQVLNVDCASGWYKPEIIENQLIFATQTQHMTDYSYIMVADLRAEDGKIMNNAQLEEYTEKFKGVTEEITEERYVMLSASMMPTAGCSGGSPYPRKEIAASCSMAWGNIKTSPARNCGASCGRK